MSCPMIVKLLYFSILKKYRSSSTSIHEPSMLYTFSGFMLFSCRYASSSLLCLCGEVRNQSCWFYSVHTLYIESPTLVLEWAFSAVTSSGWYSSLSSVISRGLVLRSGYLCGLNGNLSRLIRVIWGPQLLSGSTNSIFPALASEWRINQLKFVICLFIKLVYLLPSKF